MEFHIKIPLYNLQGGFNSQESEGRRKPKELRERETNKKRGIRKSPFENFRVSELCRECGEMKFASFIQFELIGRSKTFIIGGRNCHRKHVEDG